MFKILLFGVIANACRDNAGEHRGALVDYDLDSEESGDFDTDFELDAEFLENHNALFNQEVEALIQASFIDILGPYKFQLANDQFRSKLQSERETLRVNIQQVVEKFSNLDKVMPRCFDYKPDVCKAVTGISQLLSDCPEKLCPLTCGKCIISSPPI